MRNVIFIHELADNITFLTHFRKSGICSWIQCGFRYEVRFEKLIMNVSSHTVGQKSQGCSTNIFSSISFSYATTIRRPKICMFLFYVCSPVCWQTKLFHIYVLITIPVSFKLFTISLPGITYKSSSSPPVIKYKIEPGVLDQKLIRFHHIVHSNCKTFISFICVCYFMFIQETADETTCLTH